MQKPKAVFYYASVKQRSVTAHGDEKSPQPSFPQLINTGHYTSKQLVLHCFSSFTHKHPPD